MKDEFKKSLQITIVLVFVFLFSTAVSAQKAARINFYKKATAAIVSSRLRNFKDKKVFVIKVRRGQTLRAEQIKTPLTALHYVTVSLKNPAGETVGDANASCNNRKEITLTAAGDYTITVYECQKADAWRGRFSLKVSVK